MNVTITLSSATEYIREELVALIRIRSCSERNI